MHDKCSRAGAVGAVGTARLPTSRHTTTAACDAQSRRNYERVSVRAAQEFLESLSANGALRQERRWLELEVQKRIKHMQNKTGHKDANLDHLTDRQYGEMMAWHRDSLKKQVCCSAHGWRNRGRPYCLLTKSRNVL